MKIKKINEDKVQIIITNQDLEERDFKKWELMPLSPKTHELFQDLLDMAYEECGFEIEDDSQLMVEAYPLSVDSIAVIITKVRSGGGAEFLNMFLPHHPEVAEDEVDEEMLKIERGAKQVWRFLDIETCSRVCARIEPDALEKSALYKYRDNYYLALDILPKLQQEVAALLGEYGDWVPFDEVFLQEYAKVIIAREAVTNLASLLR